MPTFAYKGRNPRGEIVNGRLEGADAGAIADQLFNTGITPVDIAPAVPDVGSAASGLFARFSDRVSLVDVMLFSRQMYTLLKSGVPILRALAGLQESSTSVKLTEVIQDLRTSLDSGRELSTAMRRHPDVFSPFYVALVRVGEMTGMLETVFQRLHAHLDFEREMRERVESALRYPLFVTIAMAVALVIINLFVIPVFAKFYASFNAQLPFITRVLVGFSNFTVDYWPLLAAAAIGAWTAFKLYTGTPAGKYAWDKFKLRIPVAGSIVLKATLARFARSFALSLKSGVPLVQALSTVANVVENDYIGQRIEQMRDGVERGESVLRTAMTAGVFTPVVIQMIAVGDETGALDDMMLEVAEMYEREVGYELRNLSANIEPILIVMLAVLVLILALGVLLPIWNLGSVALRGGR
jgi:MSHA biogenesis protein MshG